MSPRWTVYGAAIDDWRDEEMLNDCFADLVDDSLARGPGFVNHLFNGIVEFGDGATLIATDRDPLPYRPEGTNRKIDFTIADDSQIIGFESKRRDNLSTGQLEAELEKLKYNADGRAIHLVAITEDLGTPAIIKQTPANVHWTSWFAIAKRAFDGETLGRAWQPTVSRAQKMFREFGYSEFTGINEEEFQVTVWELWKQIATQVSSVETGQRWPYNLLNEAAGGSKGYRPIDPDWMLLTYGDESGQQPSKTSYALLSNKKTREIWIGVALHPNGNSDLRDLMCENADAIANQVHDEELEVIQFPLNWLVGRKNPPPEHRKAVTASRPATRTDLTDAFGDRRGMENDGANRFVLGYRLDSEDVLEEAIGYLDRLQALFEDEDGPALRQLL